MSSFAFLLIVMIAGIFLWWLVDAAKYPRVSKAGFVMFVVGLASICYGTHPYIPGLLTR
jgi:hypothetical protein